MVTQLNRTEDPLKKEELGYNLTLKRLAAFHRRTGK